MRNPFDWKPDRDTRRLTYVPKMQRELPPPPERASIYGDTYDGVPNPFVPFMHGYPTRYHGAIWDYPMPGYQYVPQTYVKTPFLGLGSPGLGQAEAGITTTTLVFIGAAAAIFYALARDRGTLLGLKPGSSAIIGGALAALFLTVRK